MEPLLIMIVSLFIILIILLIFRKLIVLSFFRILYGHYSHEFATQFRKYYVRSPFQYCFRDELISHLLYMRNEGNGLPVIRTEKDIFFENIPYFIRYREFLSKKGAPYCFNSFSFQNPDFIINAIGYNENVAGSRAILVYYFLDDVFFMGEYIFKEPKTAIKESLLAHFAENVDLEKDQFIILDRAGRMVHFQDTGFTIEIKYLSRENAELTNKVQEYLTRLTSRERVVPEA